MKKFGILLIMLVGFSCSNYRPIVDMQNKTQQDYNNDLSQCQKYAEQISPGANAAVGAGVGAGVGAVLGAIVGAFFGVPIGEMVGFGAVMGGATGAMEGGAQGGRKQINIIKRCMQGRGYSVLN